MFWIFDTGAHDTAGAWTQPSWVAELDSGEETPPEFELLFESDLSLMVAARTQGSTVTPAAPPAAPARRRVTTTRRQACQRAR